MISVIIPVYNVAAFLERCLDSVLAQEAIREILLVDDGSTDGSGGICDRYAQTDPRITVIHKENGGLSSARNAGLDRARGEYVAFLDSDDYLEPGTYGILLGAALEHQCDLVCAGRYDLDEATGLKTPGLCPEKEEVISGRELASRIFTWQNVDSAAWDKLYRRSLFDGIRYPEGKICEDVPVTYRLALRAKGIAMVPRCLYDYCHRPNSITTAPVSEKSFHFSLHAEGICRDIAEEAPELLPPGQEPLCLVPGTPHDAVPGKRDGFRPESAVSREPSEAAAGGRLLPPLSPGLQKAEMPVSSAGPGAVWHPMAPALCPPPHG